MNNARKQYAQKFKHGAMDLVKSGKSIASVARDLGVTTTGLRHWIIQDTKTNTDDNIRIKEMEQRLKGLTEK